MKLRRSYFLIFLVITLVIVNFSSVHLFATIEKPKAFIVCNDDVLRGLKYFSYLIYVLKILIPVLIIVKSGISFANAILAGDDGQIKPTFNIFLKRCIVGAIIFFIPTIINVIVGMAPGYKDNNRNFITCVRCMGNPNQCG